MDIRLKVIEELKAEEKDRKVKAIMFSVLSAINGIGAIGNALMGKTSSSIIIGATALIWLANTILQAYRLSECRDKLCACEYSLFMDSLSTGGAMSFEGEKNDNNNSNDYADDDNADLY